MVYPPVEPHPLDDVRTAFLQFLTTDSSDISYAYLYLQPVARAKSRGTPSVRT